MTYRIEVTPKPGFMTEAAAQLVDRVRDFGVSGVEGVTISRLYFVDGEVNAQQVTTLCREVLADDVVEAFTIADLAHTEATDNTGVIEVSCKPGVTDTVGETLLHSTKLLGLDRIVRAASGHRYAFIGAVNHRELEHVAQRLLANEVVEQWAVESCIEPPFTTDATVSDVVGHIAIRDLSAEALLALSKKRRLSLDGQEMATIQAYFREQGRDPSDLELEMLAQTWSEHCVHKTFRALIDLVEVDTEGNPVEGGRTTINSMLKTFLKKATDACGKDWIRSAFVDNAGIVRFDDELDLAFKVETHNHPSALEPFGGSNTGVGGVVRDILGVSARPIANTDVLCFGLQDVDASTLPDGVMHPKRIAHGVIAGIEDYGNKMGIPTVNGAIVFEPGYTANPLVYCGCIGILPTGTHKTEPQVGDRVVVIGGKTGRDGIGGATFSSMEMSHETGEIAGSSVQIGHPINEKQVQEVVMEARDAGLYNAITDCGAGGLSSAVGEMASKLGANIQLVDVPTKYPGLQPWEVWLSEAQERMVLAVPDESWPALVAICERHGSSVTSIGRFTGDGVLKVAFGERIIGELNTEFLHDGIPQRHLRGEWVRPRFEPIALTIDTPANLLVDLLASPNLSSREGIVRQYDHEVQGGTVVKPLVGTENDGPGNATVIVPLAARQAGRIDRGVVIGCGINPHYGAIDPYAMAWSAVDEAVRNVVSVGGDPDQTSLCDNFCWGNPNLPDRLGALVRCGEGCYDGAMAYGLPYVSGKDSLNNEYTGADGQKHAIPGTILISAMSIVPNVHHTTTSDIKGAGNTLILVGNTHNELGASAAARHLGTTGGIVPQPVAQGPETARAIYTAISSGQVAACHDCADGGLALALAEMAIGGRTGLSADLSAVPTTTALDTHTKAFAESNSRYVLEVTPQNLASITHTLAGIPHAVIGQTGGDTVTLTDSDAVYLSVPVADCVKAHQTPAL